MNTTTTQGVTVSVTTNYLPDYSSPAQEHYVFAYKIDILNGSEYTVKLLRRHWYIYDANGVVREVEGEGVVGQQPVLEPGESHQYVSGCNLKSGLGKMCGSYQMERLVDGREFSVEIPEFTLVVPYRLN
ncbi:MULTISPECIES: Co2+/Mg2+ efflux protein ApaG [Hymenobacter]|uniref:Protein ApaG n=2 Tax=Hymenobacter TaxID=89966 RepID=A0A2M9AQS2_9BACT|nr:MULTISPECIES: Co2+/Mg2+ efflux protein ApaG [Hymenobacter]PJJ48032.1 ApaG protein [Hymenobacter chitinivorans DSM 11115]UOQ52731.1 Co2+/Mg2+ efflux protein ApaG [Hymenobacter cellulosivorans]